MAEATNTTNPGSRAGARPIDPAVLFALADRCEREEPSRELDAAITVANLGDGWTVSAAEGWVCIPHQEISVAPRYTTSLDAAVTLVPAGMDWTLAVRPSYSALSQLSRDAESAVEIMALKQAKTPAMALCAAALSARAALSEGEA